MDNWTKLHQMTMGFFTREGYGLETLERVKYELRVAAVHMFWEFHPKWINECGEKVEEGPIELAVRQFTWNVAVGRYLKKLKPLIDIVKSLTVSQTGGWFIWLLTYIIGNIGKFLENWTVKELAIDEGVEVPEIVETLPSECIFFCWKSNGSKMSESRSWKTFMTVTLQTQILKATCGSFREVPESCL